MIAPKRLNSMRVLAALAFTASCADDISSGDETSTGTSGTDGPAEAGPETGPPVDGTDSTTAGADSTSEGGPTAGSTADSTGGSSDSGSSSGDGRVDTSESGSTMGASSSSDGGGCDVDCSMEPSGPCEISVCNFGRYPGPVGECALVAVDDDTPCDDGLYCTVNDSCLAGECGGAFNDCGLVAGTCQFVSCDELTETCDVELEPDATPCTPVNLCEEAGVCDAGACMGTPVSCAGTVVGPCEIAVCDPTDGVCYPQSDPGQDGQPCDDGDLCSVGDVCDAGQCVSDTPLDCSALDGDCVVGVCDSADGNCLAEPLPMGTPCTDGVPQCNAGQCDATGACLAAPEPDGTPCDDGDVCTAADQCVTGGCGGTPEPTCVSYFVESFESCPPAGWTLNPEWECGVPEGVGPAAAFQGVALLGTDLDDTYDNGLAFATSFAQMPAVDLTAAVNPVLTYQHYLQSEGVTFDGYNLQVSVDGGTTFSVLSSVAPAYDLTIDGQPAFGGLDAVWAPVVADLSAYVGQVVIMRFAFRSDGSVNHPGIYADEVQVREADTIPVEITTTAFEDAIVDTPYGGTMASTGGTGNGTWSIVAETNAAWMAVSPAGALSGVPSVADLGPASVTLRIEEPTNPSNFAEMTYAFDVVQPLYFDDVDGACPSGFTLSGDWECGVPTSGPGSAFSGAQVLATNLTGNYSNNQTWATNTVTSVPIDLTTAVTPELRFRVWVNTEGSVFDGFNLRASDDGGMTYVVVPMVTPAYSLTIDGQSAWGGDQSAQGWQEYRADLTAYAGQVITLQLGMRTDGSVTAPGVYADDFVILD